MNADPHLLLDLVLVGTLLFTAFRALHAEVLFTGVVFYIAFGLVLALVWVRLEAPDLALAEAAIGAGVIGAMLLDAARQMAGDDVDRAGSGWGPARRTGAALVTLVFSAMLAAIFLTAAPPAARELPGLVARNLSGTGAEHEVTAVLLDFRAYDTWLEVGVLLAAAVGVMVLSRGRRNGGEAVSTSAIARGTAAISTPFGLLIAGYLLWRGTTAPGGAFQAGAVLGALAILLTLIGRDPLTRASTGAIYLSIIAGFAVFAAFGLAGYAASGAFLDHPERSAEVFILLIETAVTLSVGATMALLFSGGRLGKTEAP